MLIRIKGEYKLRKQIEDQQITIEILENSNRIMFNVSKGIINEKELNNKIENVKPDIVIKTQNNKLRHYFLLIKLNDNECEYTYYVIRCQKVNLKTSLDKLILEHQDCEELLRFYDPNSINLYSRIKEDFKRDLTFYGNYFRISNPEFTEQDLIRKIENLQTDKDI